jgi:hypothetical protein
MIGWLGIGALLVAAPLLAQPAAQPTGGRLRETEQVDDMHSTVNLPDSLYRGQ